MRVHSKKVLLLLALVVAVGLMSQDDCQPPDPEILAGTDCWETDPEDTVWKPKSAIPAGFFGDVNGTQSNAIPPPRFPADFHLRGVPLTGPEAASCNCPGAVTTNITWLDRHGNPTDDIRHKVDEVVEEVVVVDTCVRREQNAKFKGQGAAIKVDIELVQLSLASVDPLVVTYGRGPGAITRDFHARVVESGTQNKGTLTFTAKKILAGKADGDINLGSLPIHFEVTFEANDSHGTTTTAPITGSVDFKGSKGEFNQTGT